MFDLESSISTWRSRMLAAGIRQPDTLDELEAHLRQDFDALQTSGIPAPEAFESAVSRLGNSDSMRREFSKFTRTQRVPVTVITAGWFAALLFLTAFLLMKGLLPGRWSALLCSHIFSVTAGYSAALVAGGLGIYSVWLQLFHQLTPAGRNNLGRAAGLFTRFSVGFVAVGFFLGALWSKQNWGQYLDANPNKLGSLMGGDPKEVGAICVMLWFVATLVVQQFRPTGDRVPMLMCIGGNLLVMLAWFGAGTMAKGGRIYETPGYWPLMLVAAIHLVFLALGTLPVNSRRLKSL
jgi:hypothetical protein